MCIIHCNKSSKLGLVYFTQDSNLKEKIFIKKFMFQNFFKSFNTAT